MSLVACCSLVVACCVLFVVWCSLVLFGVHLVLLWFVACRVLLIGGWSLFVDRCFVFVGCLFVLCCLWCIVRYVPFGDYCCSLIVVC